MGGHERSWLMIILRWRIGAQELVEMHRTLSFYPLVPLHFRLGIILNNDYSGSTLKP